MPLSFNDSATFTDIYVKSNLSIIKELQIGKKIYKKKRSEGPSHGSCLDFEKAAHVSAGDHHNQEQTATDRQTLTAESPCRTGAFTTTREAAGKML